MPVKIAKQLLSMIDMSKVSIPMPELPAAGNLTKEQIVQINEWLTTIGSIMLLA